jgi:hypothetical protein
MTLASLGTVWPPIEGMVQPRMQPIKPVDVAQRADLPQIFEQGGREAQALLS